MGWLDREVHVERRREQLDEVMKPASDPLEAGPDAQPRGLELASGHRQHLDPLWLPEPTVSPSIVPR